ncbi:MAG: hypothetical protein DRN92_01400 [Thermoproteota archaeon]|nr:MAG: hypothetical protein DRN92_01400 [Candidatus Korarchaeota archaeon]
MWLGHILSALLIASFSFTKENLAIALFFNWLPNIDALLVKAGVKPKEFHDGPTHSFLFALVAGLPLIFLSIEKGIISFLSILAHLICDFPTDKGIPLLYPMKRRFSLNLWKETGFLGIKSVYGFYKQKSALLSEILLLAVLILRIPCF